MIRTDVNPGDFQMSILHIEDFTRQFKFGVSRPMLGNWNLRPGCDADFFYIDLTVKKANPSYVIHVIVDIRN